MRALSVAAIRRHARLGLKCANRIPFGVFQCRSFAVAVADNHHRRLVGFIKPIDAPRPFAERPPEQQRADLTVHEQMMRSTQRILSLKSLTPGSVQELRVVLNYWTSSRPHAIAEAMDGGKHSILLQIDALLEWILSTKIDAESLYAILRTDECVSGALINMIEQHLMPFRGTHQSLKTLSDRRLRSNQNVDELKKALTNATKIMDIIETLFDDPAYPKLVPDAYACNMMLNLWVKRCWFLAENSDLSLDDNFVNTALKGVKNVEECLEAMEECIATLPPPGSSNATALYMAAWVNSNLPNRVEKLEAILQDAEENYPVPLNEVPYNVLMHAYASNAQYKKEYATRAGTLLRHMWSRGVECDVSTYSSLLLALSNAGNPDRAIELLMQMEEQAERTNIFPNTICYNIVLDSLAKQMTKESAMRAEALLRRMGSMSEKGINPLSSPDIVSFTSVIRAWAKSKTPDAAEKAESLLLQCLERSVKRKNVAPDDMMFNTVLHAWAEHRESHKESFNRKGRGETGARRAESLMRLMKESGDIKPDDVSYNIIMNAWYNSGNYKAAAERTRELFKEMKSEYRAGDNTKKPDGITYNTVMKTLVQSRSNGCFDEARALIEEMKAEGLKPTTTTYNHLMSGVVKSGERDAVEKAEGLLEEMEEMYKNGNKDVRPNEISFNILLHVYAKSKDPRNAEKAERLLNRMAAILGKDGGEGTGPSTQSFASVLDAYANCGKSEAAENLFNRMTSSGQVHVNTVTYNTVFNALAKSRAKDAPHRAEALLNRMQEEYEAGNEEVRPNVISFSSVLNCWATSSLEGAAERAESILLRMQDLASRGSTHIAPNAICYSTVLAAWSRSKDPDSAKRAIAILERMEEAYENGQENARPNSYCYNATLNAIAKSCLADKAEMAYQLLQRMVEAHKKDPRFATPSVTSYSTVLNACAYTEGSPEQKKEAFRIARTAFSEFLESDYGDPNVVTYVNFLTACLRLIPSGATRDNFMVAVFRECHEKGLVNDKVVSVLQRGVTPDAFLETMSSLKLS